VSATSPLQREGPRFAITCGLAVVIAAIFTWPAPISGSSQLVARGFDGEGMLWMGWFMEEHFSSSGLYSSITGWPRGEPLYANDGWLYLLACWLFPGISTAVGYHLWAWLGCAATFVAGERMAARGFGARWPWSLAAGLVFACNGVGAAALAEGRVYQLAQWPVPLFFLVWKRLLDGRSTGAQVGLMWSLCLLTSAYSAILVSIGALFLWAWQFNPHRQLRQIALAALLALPVGVVFGWLFVHSPRLTTWTIQITSLTNCATLSGLLGWSPAPSSARGFGSPTLGFVSLALALAATSLLPRKVWLPLLSGAALAVVLSFGPRLGVTPSDPDPLWLPWGWASKVLPSLSFFRFPVRFLLLAHLALGTLAALALTHASRQRALRFALATALLLDAFFWSTPSLTLPRTTPAPGNSVYSLAVPSQPILDIIPDPRLDFDYALLSVIHHICAHQPQHGRPIPENCLDPRTVDSPAISLRQQLQMPLLNGDAQLTSFLLQEHNIGSVVLHGDLFSAPERENIQQTLSSISHQVQEASGGGEYLQLYTVPPPLPR